MKYFAIAIAVLVSQSAGFQVVHRHQGFPSSSRLYATEYEPLEGEGKINLKIDLESPKVATMVSL
jgi:hypothetical protein